jgi:hypothetical protein
MAEIPRNCTSQHSERIVTPTFGNLTQEGKEEHDENGDHALDNLTTGFMAQTQNLVHKDLVQSPRPYPHERDYEI